MDFVRHSLLARTMLRIACYIKLLYNTTTLDEHSVQTGLVTSLFRLRPCRHIRTGDAAAYSPRPHAARVSGRANPVAAENPIHIGFPWRPHADVATFHKIGRDPRYADQSSVRSAPERLPRTAAIREDDRVVNLSLTKRGRRAVGRIKQYRQEFFADLCDTLSHADCQRLIDSHRYILETYRRIHQEKKGER